MLILEWKADKQVDSLGQHFFLGSRNTTPFYTRKTVTAGRFSFVERSKMFSWAVEGPISHQIHENAYDLLRKISALYKF